MADSQTKLKTLLRELFQLDSADLDFGIYRIMNSKRSEIERFLDNDLLPQIKEAFLHYKSSDSAHVKAELDKVIQQLKDAGVDPELSPKVKEYREKLATAIDVSALENQVFSDLFNFFRRYYNEGDFLSLRRYKEGVYAIPYEGEEVKLYWANHDQFYIKSSEYLRDYAFKLSDGRRVHFRLAAADIEKDNNKPANGNDRRFILADGKTVAEESGELVIRFEFRSDAEKRRQDALNAHTIKAILEAPATAAWQFALAALDPSEADPNRTVLARHLKDYTARNTFDYFIHKDVGPFLRRELDFFIKNEVMHLDDVESSSAPRVEQYLSRIRVLRSLATKLIDFVAQLEDFQKKLWLKKKFVVESNYCITLDRVPEELYTEIAANASQVDEWVRLFRLDLIHGDLAHPGFSAPPTAEFLRSQPSLVLDTRHFAKEFKDRLLSSPKLADLDEATDGLLVQADSFQALSTLLNSYRGAAKTIYIDPPYNTKKDIFPYKDGYKHGSWLSMIADRISLGRQWLRSDGVLFSSIDTNELPRLQLLLNEVFGIGNHIGDIVWRNARDNNPTQIAVEHEYVVCYAKDAGSVEPIWKNSFADAKELLQAEYQRLKQAGLAASAIQDGIRTFIKDNEEILGEVDRYKFVDDDGVYTGSQSVHNPHPNGYDFEILHPETQRPMRKPANGYRFPESTMKREYIDKDRLIYGPDENRIVQIKLYLTDYQDSLRSVIDLDGRLGAYALSALFGKGSDLFDNPKPPQLLKRLISFGSAPDSLVLDFFAGSGSTVQAAIEVARQTSVRMKYICVEMANYFETVLIPRVKKVIYSDDWKDGTPVSRRGSSHVFKYIRLESYEDSLNNLELRRTEVQGSLLETNAGVREDYNLRYMLDVESKGSASLLNIDSFREPFSYTLNVSTGTVGETTLTSADLVETFNYLLGLQVKHIDAIRGFRVVHGTNPGGEKVLVIWRNAEENPNAKLDEFFQKQGYNTKDMEFDLIYVNGDNNLENLKKDEDTWKVRLIEEEFARLMFDVQDV